MKLDRDDNPFTHLTASDVLTEADADAVLQWLEHDCPWSDRDEAHYRSSVRHLDPENLPAPIGGVLDAEFRAELRRSLELQFDVTFSDKQMCMANKYVVGDGTAVHTDYDPSLRGGEYFFTHRFLLYLNDGWTPENGGLLGLFGDDETRPVATVEPLHNSGAGMAMGPRSRHAVSAQKSGTRYAMVFSYETCDQVYQD